MALMSEYLNKVEEDFTVTRCNNGFVIKQAGRQQDGEWKMVKLVCATTEELDVQIANIHTIPLE